MQRMERRNFPPLSVGGALAWRLEIVRAGTPPVVISLAWPSPTVLRPRAPCLLEIQGISAYIGRPETLPVPAASPVARLGRPARVDLMSGRGGAARMNQTDTGSGPVPRRVPDRRLRRNCSARRYYMATLVWVHTLARRIAYLIPADLAAATPMPRKISHDQ